MDSSEFTYLVQFLCIDASVSLYLNSNTSAVTQARLNVHQESAMSATANENQRVYNCKEYPPQSTSPLRTEHDRPYVEYGHLSNQN